MSPQDLFRLQLKLECKEIAGESALARAPCGGCDWCGDPEDVPRVLVAQLGQDVRVLLRHDVPAAVRRAVLARPPHELLRDPALVEEILRAHAPASPAAAEWLRSYTVPPTAALTPTDPVVRVSGGHPPLLATFFDRGFYDLAWRSPVFAVVHGGAVVSACMSWRESAGAAEAWVATDPAHRGHGHGTVAVSAWARACHAGAKVAFYSHKEGNAGSAGIARALRLPQWGRMASYA